MQNPARLSSADYAAGALRALSACVLGWLIAFAASVLTNFLIRITSPAETQSLGWVLTGTGWIATVSVGACVLAIAGKRHAAIVAIAAALGGVSALFAPLVVYGLPLGLAATFWFEAFMLGFFLPVAIIALAKKFNWHVPPQTSANAGSAVDRNRR
jgi:hypothetical protein